MNKILIVASLLMFSSCIQKIEKIEVKDDPQPYMSTEEILAEFSKKDIKASFSTSPQYNENLKSLIPAESFISTKMKTESHKLPLIKASGVAVKDMVSLRDRDTSVKSQGSTPHCTAFSLMAIMENIINKKGSVSGLDLSDEHAWSLYKQPQMDAAIRTISNKKVCDEKDFPFTGKPNSTCDKNAHAMIVNYKQIGQDQVFESLSNGNPVYLGLGLPRGVVNCESVIKDLTPLSNSGHAVAIVGYNKTGSTPYYIIKNSWGKSCGDGGYFYMPVDFCKKSWCYFYEVSIVSSKYDSNPTPIPTVNPPKCVKWKAIWYTLGIKKRCVAWE